MPAFTRPAPMPLLPAMLLPLLLLAASSLASAATIQTSTSESKHHKDMDAKLKAELSREIREYFRASGFNWLSPVMLQVSAF